MCRSALFRSSPFRKRVSGFVTLLSTVSPAGWYASEGLVTGGGPGSVMMGVCSMGSKEVEG
jgi:hypothetical protein